MGASIYTVDSRASKRQDTIHELDAQIDDLGTILHNTSATRRSELVRLAANLECWTTVVRREKAIFTTLNLFNFDEHRGALLAQGWVPTNRIQDLQLALRRAAVGPHVPPSLLCLHVN